MLVVVPHPQRGLVHKLGITAEQATDVVASIRIAGRVFQVGFLASIINREQALRERLVNRPGESLGVENTNTHDTLGGIDHLAVSTLDLDLLAIGVVDRRFAHREGQRDYAAGLCLACDILADPEAVFGQGIGVDREHIAVLGHKHLLRLTRSERAKDGQEVLLVGLRDIGVGVDGCDLLSGRDARTDRIAIGVDVDLHPALVFGDGIERVLHSPCELVAQTTDLLRCADVLAVIGKHPVKAVTLDEVDTALDRDHRVVQVDGTDTVRTIAACGYDNLVVEGIQNRRADDLVALVEEVATKRSIAGLDEPHPGGLKLAHITVGVLPGKHPVGRVEQVLEKAAGVVADSPFAKQGLLEDIEVDRGSLKTTGCGETGAIASTATAQVHRCQNPSHSLTGRIDEASLVLEPGIAVTLKTTLIIQHKPSALLGRHIGRISPEDLVRHLPTDGVRRSATTPHHIHHLRHQVLDSGVGQQGVPALGDSA